MRQFVADCDPDSKGCISVTGRKYHYLSSVLRAERGDMLYVRLGDGTLQPMTVADINTSEKKIVLTVAGGRVEASATKAAPVEDKPRTQLWLFQFIAKPPKMDLIIRQAVECGVSFIVPVEGTFCQKGNVESARKKASPDDTRWHRIITEAREQSGSPVDTKVLPCVGVDEACRLWSERNADGLSFGVTLYEQSERTRLLHQAVKEYAASAGLPERLALAVGAEGGIAPEEVEKLSAAGFVPVHFDTNILRCETAAIYGLAALQCVVMESDIWL